MEENNWNWVASGIKFLSYYYEEGEKTFSSWQNSDWWRGGGGKIGTSLHAQDKSSVESLGRKGRQ